MGAQQITDTNRESLYFDFEDKLIKESNKLYLYDKFRVDCIEDKQKYMFILSVYNTLKNGHCELSEYICKYFKEVPQKNKFCKINKKHNCQESDNLPKCCPVTDIGKVEF